MFARVIGSLRFRAKEGYRGAYFIVASEEEEPPNHCSVQQSMRRGGRSLGGFIYLRAKLNNLSALPRCPFQRCSEVRRDVKLNYFRHAYFLMPANLCGLGLQCLYYFYL
jgi:hypothetical protein